MNVRELKEILKQHPDDMPVVMDAYGGHYNIMSVATNPDSTLVEISNFCHINDEYDAYVG